MTDTASAPATTATRYDVRQGAAWITQNRPEQRNALSAALVNELSDHLNAALADPAVRCIVLTGAGSAFCAGADLKSPPGQVVDGRQGVSLAEFSARREPSFSWESRGRFRAPSTGRRRTSWG